MLYVEAPDADERHKPRRRWCIERTYMQAQWRNMQWPLLTISSVSKS